MAFFAEENLSADWSPLKAILEFDRNPSRDNLVFACSEISRIPDSVSFWQQVAAWPIAQCLHMGDLSEIPLNADDCWRSVDGRIRSDGIDLSDLLRDQPCWEYISINGIRAWSVTAPDKDVPKETFPNSLLDRLEVEGSEEIRDILIFLFAFATRTLDVLHLYAPNRIWRQLAATERTWRADAFALSTLPSAKTLSDWIVFFENFGKLKLLPASSRPPTTRRQSTWMFKSYFDGMASQGVFRVASLLGWPIQGDDINPFEKFSADPASKENIFPLISVLLNRIGGLPSNDSFVVQAIENRTNELSFNELEFLIEIVERQSARGADVLPVIDALLKRVTVANWQLVSRLEVVRSAVLQAISSGFDNKTLQILGLPQVTYNVERVT